MSKEDDLLRTIILKAIEAEGLPVPAIWKHNLTELCFRVVRKLIGVEACIVSIAKAALPSSEAQASHAVSGDSQNDKGSEP